MLAIVSVDTRLDFWAAQLLPGPDEDHLRPPRQDKLLRWLEPGIAFQKDRVAGQFFAVMPE